MRPPSPLSHLRWILRRPDLPAAAAVSCSHGCCYCSCGPRHRHLHHRHRRPHRSHSRPLRRRRSAFGAHWSLR